jgi:hypothetical protein
MIIDLKKCDLDIELNKVIRCPLFDQLTYVNFYTTAELLIILNKEVNKIIVTIMDLKLE